MIGKFLLLAAIALSAGSCLSGQDDDTPTPDGPSAVFSATVSPSAIYADGSDAAVFDVRFRGTRLTADDVTFYNADDNSVVEMPDMKFTTTQPGEYAFYVTYVNAAPQEGEEAEYKSERLVITAMNEDINLDPTDQQGLTASLSSTVVQTGKDRAVFVIRYDGEVLDSDAGYDIYDGDTNRKITLPTLQKTSSSGVTYNLPYYEASQSETRSFWIAYKTSNTINQPMNVTAIDREVPIRPIDPQPENTTFKHRAMFTQFTGLGCGYCPFMIAALRSVLSDSEYSSKAVLGASHTYGGDPYAPNVDLGSIFSITGYPMVLVDFNTRIGNYGYEPNITNLKEAIDNSLQTPAKAGISARMAKDGSTLVMRMTIKVNETNNYRVGAWVLEDGLTGHQSNYGMDGDFDTHDAVIRYVDSKDSHSSSYAGHDLGYIQAGEMADYLFVIPIDSEWVEENCRLLLFVTAANGKNYTVTNAVATSSLTSAVTLEYE